MKDQEIKRFKKLSFSDLGERVNELYSYGVRAREKFISSSEDQKRELLELSIRDTSKRVYTPESYTLDGQYQYSREIAHVLQMENPLERFATVKKNEKFLGYGHVWLLSYGWLLKQVPGGISPFLHQFPLEHIARQGRLIKKKEKIQSLFDDFDSTRKEEFLLWLQGLEYYLSIRDYSQIKTAIAAFEEEFQIVETLLSENYIDTSREEHQIFGIFNAVVSVLSGIR